VPYRRMETRPPSVLSQSQPAGRARGEGIRSRVVVPDGGESRLLRPGEVARVDQVVGQDVPRPRPRGPEVVEGISRHAGHRAVAIGPGEVRVIEDHRPARLGRGQELHLPGLVRRQVAGGELLCPGRRRREGREGPQGDDQAVDREAHGGRRHLGRLGAGRRLPAADVGPRRLQPTRACRQTLVIRHGPATE